MKISRGFHPSERQRIAELYWDAFGTKLGRVMGPTPKAHRFLNAVLDPNHALNCRDEDGQLLGVLGFKTFKGALVAGTFQDMRRVYGLIGAAWRGGLLSLLERDVENERFLLDGVFVAPEARGCGVGTRLLEAAFELAQGRGYSEIRLDVIDSNPRAKALYERLGFVGGEEHHLGLLGPLFRFKSALTMVRPLGGESL